MTQLPDIRAARFFLRFDFSHTATVFVRRGKTNTTSQMKNLLCSLLIVGATSIAICDDKVVKTTTTTSTGTISEYAPGQTFIVKETSGPVTYRYGKTVTYTTRSGKTLTDDQVRTRIKVGAPVSVHYATEGETRVISRVEVEDDD